MRFNGLVLGAALAIVSACGGGDNAATTDTGSATSAPAAGGAAGVAAAAPVTGTWHEVKMIGDERGYRYDPVDITIKAGDGVRWIMVSGQPHNVQFTGYPAEAKAQLSANMPNQLSELSGPIMLNPNETYEISFAGTTPGKYDYLCTPHQANNMRGSVTVQ